MTQVWSTINISTHLSGGGTTTVTLILPNGSWQGVLGTEGAPSGTTGRYWETQFANTTNIGNETVGVSASADPTDGFIGITALGIGVDKIGRAWYNNASTQTALTYNPTTDRIATQLDQVAHTISWRNVTTNGAWTTPLALNATIYNSTVYPAASTDNTSTNNEAITGFFDGATWGGTPQIGFGPWDPTVTADTPMNAEYLASQTVGNPRRTIWWRPN